MFVKVDVDSSEMKKTQQKRFQMGRIFKISHILVPYIGHYTRRCNDTRYLWVARMDSRYCPFVIYLWSCSTL